MNADNKIPTPIESSFKMNDGCGVEVEVTSSNHPEFLDDRIIVSEGREVVEVNLSDEVIGFLMSHLQHLRTRRDNDTMDKVLSSEEVVFSDGEMTLETGDPYRLEPKYQVQPV